MNIHFINQTIKKQYDEIERIEKDIGRLEYQLEEKEKTRTGLELIERLHEIHGNAVFTWNIEDFKTITNKHVVDELQKSKDLFNQDEKSLIFLEEQYRKHISCAFTCLFNS